MAGMSLYGFLFTWLLVGILQRPAADVGVARALAEFPPLLMLLLGGLLGDRMNQRSFLLLMHVLMALPALGVLWLHGNDRLGFAWVVVFGVTSAGLQALSDPARQAVLSRVTRTDVQRTITITTIATSLVGVAGFAIGGRLDAWGLPTVLLLQAGLFLLGAGPLLRLPSLPPPRREPVDLLRGVRATWSLPLVRNVILLNFASSLFNGGAYIVAIPYIATEVYGGDAAFLARVMIVFTVGSIGSNVLLLRFMPLRHPGRLFLLMQLTRVAILAVLWLRPSVWLFFVALFAWGLNMGVTTTLVRTTVQELAPARTRAQILSILLLSFMVASPISAVLLGFLITGSTPLTALLPGIAVSLLIFLAGRFATGLWRYASAEAGSLRAIR